MFASRNDMSLKQHLFAAAVKAILSGNCDDWDFKMWKWRAKVKGGFKLHHYYSILSKGKIVD